MIATQKLRLTSHMFFNRNRSAWIISLRRKKPEVLKNSVGDVIADQTALGDAGNHGKSKPFWSNHVQNHRFPAPARAVWSAITSPTEFFSTSGFFLRKDMIQALLFLPKNIWLVSLSFCVATILYLQDNLQDNFLMCPAVLTWKSSDHVSATGCIVLQHLFLNSWA